MTFRDMLAQGGANNSKRQEELRRNDPVYTKLMKEGKFQAAFPVDPVTGQPLRPSFESMLKKDGTIKNDVQNPVDMRGIEALRTQAFRTGPSQWAELQKASQADELANRMGGQRASALTGLASQGGLSSGARERVMQNSLRGGLLGGQQASRDIAMQDEQNRQGALQSLPGQELALAQYDRGTKQYNTDRASNETLQKRAFDINNYNEQMRGWASAKTAAATPSSGKK